MKKLVLTLLIGVTTLSAFTQVPSNVPTNGLVGYWPFNGNANDESGNANDLLNNSGNFIIDRNGVNNKAISFTGENSNLSKVNISPSFSNTTQTISYWFKLPSQFNYSTLSLISNGIQYTNGFSIFIDQNDGAYGVNNYAIGYMISNGQAITFSSNQTELNNWNNLITTYDGTSIKIYLNNILKSSLNFNGNINPPNNDMNVANWSNQTKPVNTNRYVDDIGIWNRALTQQEITALYSGISPCTTPIAAIAPQSTTTICQNGSVVLNASTGSGYTYEWYKDGNIVNGSIGSSYTANQSGSYTVKVINGACNATSSATTVTVNPNPTAVINAAGVSTFCQGGSVVLNASTGTGYTYEWYKNGNIINGSIGSSYTAIQSGSYTVKVINGACNATSSATTVTVNPNPTAAINAAGVSTFCQGGSVVLNASTGTGYTYEWYKNGNIINGSTTSTYTANQSGSYTVKVINGSCNATSSATTVTVNPNPTVSLSLANFIHIKESPVTLAGSPSGGTYSGAGVVGSTFSSTNAGLGKKTITYNYTTGAGCSGSATAITTVYDTTACSTFDTLFINIAVAGLIAPNNLGTLKIWPNPANDHITIDNGNYVILSGYSVKIETVLGQEVFKSAINQQQFSVDLTTWNGKGVYLVHVLDNQNNIIETKKIVLQ